MILLRSLVFSLPALLPAQAAASDVLLATFDNVWTTVQKNHFDPDFNGVDWDAVREELRPRAEAAVSNEEARDVIREMLARLGQSHFSLVPKEGLPEADAKRDQQLGGCGFDVRFHEEQFLVTHVDRGSPAYEAGVRMGWILTKVGDQSCADLVEEIRSKGTVKWFHGVAWRQLMSKVLGKVGETVSLGFLDSQDQPVEIEVQRVDRGVETFAMTGLPVFYLHFESYAFEIEGARIGVVHWSNWFHPLQDDIDEALWEMRDCDGVILDLRGNTGGEGTMVGRVAGHFFEDRVELGVQKMRRGEMRYRAQTNRGGRDPYLGPLAILTDGTTGSASEVFSGGMQSVERALIFGRTTGGAVLPGTTKMLPNGDGLLYAIGDFRTATGVLLEGRGVIPDVPVPLHRFDLLLGADATLETAVEWILDSSL